MRQISKILYFIVIMAFMVPFPNIEANEKAPLQDSYRVVKIFIPGGSGFGINVSRDYKVRQG
jgi:hypothetical protein